MMDWLRGNPLVAALAVVALLLLAVIGGEAALSRRVDAGTTPAHAAASEAKLLPPLAVISPEQAYPETADRPLFNPTRRPAPEAPAAEKNSFQKGQFVLQGVIAVGATRTAMLREKSSGKIIRVDQGKDVNGIKVLEIQPEVVTLAMGNDREVLNLTVQKPPGAPQAPTFVNPTGPFTPPAGTPGAPGVPPGMPTPAPAPAPVPGQPFVPPPAPGAAGQPANPIARPGAESAAAPLTPEELLARRRARRSGQAQ